jgi:hypothetical protein
MNPNSFLLGTAILTIVVRVHAQDPTAVSQTPAVSPQSTVSPTPAVFEPLPTLDASVILQAQYLKGPNFTVRNPVPTYSGSNHYTIDSDFGVFEADGNEMLMRRVAEINAIAITELKGLTVCQTNDGGVVVPIQWDYVAWTPQTDRFVAAIKAQKFSSPASSYSVILTGVVSPLAAQALSARRVSVITKALPGPLQ